MATYGSGINAEDTDDLRKLMGGFTLRVGWVRSSLTPQFETEFQRACYALLKNSARAKFCQNPDCPRSIFIASGQYRLTVI